MPTNERNFRRAFLRGLWFAAALAVIAPTGIAFAQTSGSSPTAGAGTGGGQAGHQGGSGGASGQPATGSHAGHSTGPTGTSGAGGHAGPGGAGAYAGHDIHDGDHRGWHADLFGGPHPHGWQDRHGFGDHAGHRFDHGRHDVGVLFVPPARDVAPGRAA